MQRAREVQHRREPDPSRQRPEDLRRELLLPGEERCRLGTPIRRREAGGLLYVSRKRMGGKFNFDSKEM